MNPKQNHQLVMFGSSEEISPETAKSSAPNKFLKKVPILFRNTIPEIPSTTYGTFSIYKYPAKFIPQVIAYAFSQKKPSEM